jgi:hypothetical protein
MGRTIYLPLELPLVWKKKNGSPSVMHWIRKIEKGVFDEMCELPKFYISACSISVQYVRLHPILMSILLYHYKQLTACISEVKETEAKVNSKKEEWLTRKKEGRKKP